MVHIHAFQVGTTGLWSGVLGQVNRLGAVHLPFFNYWIIRDSSGEQRFRPGVVVGDTDDEREGDQEGGGPRGWT